MTDIAIKNGVDMSDLDPRIWSRAQDIANVFRTYGVQPVITSARRKARGRFSYHHVGRALDFRAKHIASAGTRKDILEDLQRTLGDDFDVVLHGEGDNIHYHIEYDPPKEGRA